MKFNSDPGWLKKQAALEDNCFVSVGGLVSAVEDLEQKSQQATASRTAFVNLLNLARREHKLTLGAVLAKIGRGSRGTHRNRE